MTDITLQNLESELIQASMQQPVLLDIWAPWCGPCKALGPLLDKLEAAYGGRFKLAKLNSDEQPEIAGQLSQSFGVRSIPFCVLFDKGQPVDGFVGAVPEAQIREFLDRHLPSEEAVQAEAEVLEAQVLEADGDVEAALAKLQQAVAVDPANEGARFDYLKLLLETGHVQQARQAFEPVANQGMQSPRLVAIGLWLSACEKSARIRPITELEAAIATDRRDFDARYELAQGLMAKQRFTEAMDALLEIVMRDKEWSQQLARKTYVAILELMTKPAPRASAEKAKGALELTGKVQAAPSDPVIDQYRRKLSMALF